MGILLGSVPCWLLSATIENEGARRKMDPGAGGGEKEWIQMGRRPLDAVLVTEGILQEKAVRRSL